MSGFWRGGTFSATVLSVAAKGEISGFGAIAAPLENDGIVQGFRGALDLTGDVTGSGTLKVFGSSTLEFGGTVASTETVAFSTGVHAVLKLDAPTTFQNAISSWALADTIDLAKTDATSAAITGSTLAVDLVGGGTLDYALNTPPTNVRIVLSSDGEGGTDITLYKPKVPAASPALMAQHMAAFGSAGIAATGHGGAVDAAPAAMIVIPNHG